MAPLPNTEAHQILAAYQTDLSKSRREVICDVAWFSLAAVVIILGAKGANEAPFRWACRLLLIPVLATIPYAIKNLIKRNEIAKNEVLGKIIQHLSTHRWEQFEKIDPIPGQTALPIHYHAENRA